MLDGFKHRSAEQSLAIIQRADLTGRKGALRFLVFEFGAAITERTEDGIARRAAIARLGLELSLIIQRLSGAGNRVQHGFARPQQRCVGAFDGDDEFVRLRTLGDDDICLLVQRTGDPMSLALTEGVKMQSPMLAEHFASRFTIGPGLSGTKVRRKSSIFTCPMKQMPWLSFFSAVFRPNSRARSRSSGLSR